MTKQKLGPRQRKWLRALESGKFKQTREKLFSGRGYCCLAVACVVAGIKPVFKKEDGVYTFDDERTDLPQWVADWFGFFERSGGHRYHRHLDELTVLNDDLKYSLKNIAATIRANPLRYFRRPV